MKITHVVLIYVCCRCPFVPHLKVHISVYPYISVICTTKKYDRSCKCICDVRKKRLFHNRPCTWQSSFSLTSRELYRIIFCLKVLLIFLCVYLLAKITLRDICHELSKQARVYFELICIAGQYAPTVLTLKP